MNPIRPISLQDIIQQANAVGGMLEEQSQKITDILTSQAAIVLKDKNLLDQAAADAELVTKTKAAADLSTQEAKLKVGNDFGTNRQAQNQVFSALASMEQEAWGRQLAAKQKIDQKQSVGLMDNPIQFIINQLTINKDIQEHNSANQTRQAVLQRIQDLNAATQSSAVTQAHFTQTITQESADAATRLAAVNHRRAMLEADVKSYQYNIEAIRVARDVPIKQLEMMFQLNSAQNAASQLALAQRGAARQDMLAQLQIEREKRLAAKEIKDEKEKVAEESSMVNYVNVGRALRGLAPLTDITGKQALQILRTGQNHPLFKEFYFDYSKGQEQEFLVGVDGKGAQFAKSGAEMIALQQSGLVFNATPEQKVVLNRLKDALAIVQAENAKKPLDPKDREGAMKRLNDAVAQVVANDQQNVRLGDSSNPYSIPTLNVLAAAVPSIAQNPAYVKSLKARVEAGEDFTDPRKIFTALAEDMKEGKLSYQEAISASEIFTRAVAMNNASKSFHRFGLPEATTFNTIVDVLPWVPGGSEQVNFLRPDSLGRALLKGAVNTKPFRFAGEMPNSYDPASGPPSIYADPEQWKAYRQYQQSQKAAGAQ